MTATAPAAPAKVYFTNLRTHARESQLDKLKRLIRHAGIEQIDFENKFVAIKIHFGELGNLSFLRPNYARAVADVVKELGGKPFLTDCNTLYVGSRKNALEHIDTAYQNGFTPYATGCQIIIADGLKGTDEALVPVEGGEYVHEAKIGQALMDADIVISLTHFKGHEQAGFGGAMKNLGMGGGSRAGKRRRIFARVAQGDTHATNRIYINALTLTKRSKKLLHSSLLGGELLLIRTIERRTPTASFHDRTGRLGVHSLTRRRNLIFM